MPVIIGVKWGVKNYLSSKFHPNQITRKSALLFGSLVLKKSSGKSKVSLKYPLFWNNYQSN